MNKFIVRLLLLLFPSFLFADSPSSISLAPPSGDISVVFLADIFGVVDNVLHGTGSQIMGAMFGVFNSAVLSIGGVIIMYTLLVSTLNTAHQGEVLGKEWSSIWIPLRSALGLALLIPKASGYCVMQIFVMWIVVQGVGAADKVWDAALDYLNRGGVIIQTQQGGNILTGGNSAVANGAAYLLAAQVCMLGVEQSLQIKRQSYQNLSNLGQTLSPSVQDFVNTPVPDFIGSVNFVQFQQANGQSDSISSFSIPLPNFTMPPYSQLNGLCGTFTWNAMTAMLNGQPVSLQTYISNNLANNTLSGSDISTAVMSRAIALQQMYNDLSMVAQVMVNNNPKLSTINGAGNASQNANNYGQFAVSQFGIPYQTSGGPCAVGLSPNCQNWGPDTSATTTTAPLFSGTELQGAIADYDGVIMPTLNLITQLQSSTTAQSVRGFIEQAESQGWLAAGSYFFYLANISTQNSTNSLETDTSPGFPMGNSFSPSNIGMGFDGPSTCKQGTIATTTLCTWFQNDPTLIYSVIDMLNYSQTGGAAVVSMSVPEQLTALSIKPVTGQPGSATTYAYITNALMIQLPGQPGLNPPSFNLQVNLNFNTDIAQMPKISFGCGSIGWPLGCVGRMFGELFYNDIFLFIYNMLLTSMMNVMNMVFMALMVVPLELIAQTFKENIEALQQPTANPIVALAQMGINFINSANALWIQTTVLEVTTSFIPILGEFLLIPLIAMAMPLMLAWVGVMMGVGFITAYYVPFLPYMIFLFGGIAWMMAVIEAMVAAPIVALGITHPEGHQAFGKGEHAVMILMNVFLRPSMMIIGYIAAIALAYVSVWMLNSGFSQAMVFLGGTSGYASPMNYTNWAGLYAMFFSVLVYATIYLTVVQKSFTLITYLPDKVLRWIGGQAESIGSESSQWAEEAKGKVSEMGKDTQQAQGASDSAMKSSLPLPKNKGSEDSNVSAQGGNKSKSQGNAPSGGE